MLLSMATACELCRTNGDLQNSHIIPEFFYRLIRDEMADLMREVRDIPCLAQAVARLGAAIQARQQAK